MNYLFTLILRIILKRFFILFIIITLLITTLLLLPIYIYFLNANYFIAFNINYLQRYFILKIPLLINYSVIYTIYYCGIMLIYYIKKSHIEKILILSGVTYQFVIYYLLIVSFIILILNFIGQENYSYNMDNEAENMLNWNSVSNTTKAIYKDNNSFYFLQKRNKMNKTYYEDVVIDRLNETIPQIITAKYAELIDKRLRLDNGTINFVTDSKIEYFQNIYLDFKPSRAINIFSKSIIKMNTSGLSKIILENSDKDINVIKIFRNYRYISLINQFISLFFIYFILLNFKSTNIFYYYLIIGFMIIFNELCEFIIKEIFIKLSLTNFFLIFLEGFVIFIIWLFITFIFSLIKTRFRKY